MNGWQWREITVEKPDVTTIDTDSGTDITGWVPLVTTGSPAVAERFPARVRDMLAGRSEAARNGLVLGKERAELVMRWRGDIDASMRVTIHGDSDVLYQIIAGPVESGGRKREISLVLERYSS
jgi:hypothetical protein